MGKRNKEKKAHKAIKIPSKVFAALMIFCVCLISVGPLAILSYSYAVYPNDTASSLEPYVYVIEILCYLIFAGAMEHLCYRLLFKKTAIKKRTFGLFFLNFYLLSFILIMMAFNLSFRDNHPALYYASSGAVVLSALFALIVYLKKPSCPVCDSLGYSNGVCNEKTCQNHQD